jgi:Ca-activated chloride channel homolog
MKRILSFIFILSSMSGCSNYEFPSLQTLYTDFLAARNLKSEKYEEALAQYYALLENDADRAGTHSNIGVLLNMVQKSEEALKSLNYALALAEKNQNPREIFTVRYNLGVYFGAQKKYAEALENYQAALELVPTSIEIKTNIELLIQQQQKQQQGQNGEKKQDSQSGEGKNDKQDPQEGQDKKDQKDQQDGKDPKDQDQKDKKDKKDNDSKDGKEKKDQKRQSSPKYQPRPFKGDELSEGDVKKILGELREQEQKIRAHFDKKEKGKSKSNEKDW